MNKRILYLNPRSELLAWPRDWQFRYRNGGEECDVLVGPCSCGAWHHAEEWSDHPDNILSQGFDMTRRINGVPVLELYNAEIRPFPVDASRELRVEVLGEDEVLRLEAEQRSQSTLSYF